MFQVYGHNLGIKSGVVVRAFIHYNAKSACVISRRCEGSSVYQVTGAA